MQIGVRQLSASIAAVAVVLLSACGASAAPAVTVFPSPGSRSALPGTQIAFRGIAPSGMGNVQVTGSKSGTHTGRIVGDSDGDGASFLPTRPFAAGENVTVSTGLNVVRGAAGFYTFKTVTPGRPIGSGPFPFVKGPVQRFRSRPDLQPPAVQVTKSTPAASPGLIFTAPQTGPAQDGPLILDGGGNVVWFQPLPRGQQATDLRPQTLRGKPVLTWWQGIMNVGLGTGTDVIADTSYRRIATVRAANGLNADLHEFLITPRGTALIVAASPVRADLSSAKGPRSGTVVDSVIQEIDIPTGLVLFEWHSLDHIPLSDSYVPYGPNPQGYAYDYFHVNSAGLDNDGNVIASARNTSAIYKIDHGTGELFWRLGGKRSSFQMKGGTTFAYQHDARVQPDGTITLFDDGAAPAVHTQSRAVRIRLDTAHHTAAWAGQDEHSGPLLAAYEGNAQRLPSGNWFVGWGQQPYFTEFDAKGRTVFDLHFLAATSSYRGYRMPWSAQPASPPDLAAAATGGGTNLWASWNGATTVARWRILSGPAATNLHPHSTLVPRRGFETAMFAGTPGPYFAVQALGAGGQVLATSRVVKAS